MHKINLTKKQDGQAMTEFLVTAVYLLVPLFLMIPLLGKYIDIKHAGINAARYQAWEYTAWNNAADDHDILNNYSASSLPYKSPAVTAKESERRLFSRIQESNPVAIGNTDSGGWKVADRNPLWTHHNGISLYDGSTLGNPSTANDTPGFTIAGFDVGSLVSAILKAFDYVFGAFGSALGLLGGNATFSATNTEGYTRTNLDLPVRIYERDVQTASGTTTYSADTSTILNFKSRAGVLSEGWSSGGFEHTYNQVGGAVPTTILKQILTVPPLSWAWSVIEFMAPEMTSCLTGGRFSLAKTLGLIPNDGSLWLGYIDSDTVHPDRLSGGGVHVCDDAGRCRLDPNIPLSHTRCIP